MQTLFTERALKDFKKLTPPIQKRLIKKLEFFAQSKDPLKFSEALVNSTLGKYRFRVGDYRVIFDFPGDALIILRLGHRKYIYK